MFRTGHFLLPMPLTCSPSGVERWGAAANPGGDYGEMCHHYKISTSVEMKEIKGSTGGRWGRTLRGKSRFHVWFMAQAAASDMFVSFHLKYKGRQGGNVLFISHDWDVCSVVLRGVGLGGIGGIQVLWKQQGFTVFHTASEVLHQAFAHAYIKISSHKEMSGVTKSFWPS